ncbi:MAG: hypothetical protein Q4A25_01210 [Candidatus Saccharibacteria bacterium]|nr:hypothetical protein [Candidatus Saccharibacteria bacterium]
MISEVLQKMKANMIMATAQDDMSYKSGLAENRFSALEALDASVSEAKSVARVAEKVSVSRKGYVDVTDSLLYKACSIVEICHGNDIDIRKVKAILSTYWKYGNQIPMDRPA